jgi:hypothetical protein
MQHEHTTMFINFTRFFCRVNLPIRYQKQQVSELKTRKQI